MKYCVFHYIDEKRDHMHVHKIFCTYTLFMTEMQYYTQKQK